MKKKTHIPAVVPIVRAACLVGPNGMPCDGGEISAKKQSGVSGTVMFEDDGNECKITYTVSGLTPGMHGFHIHEKADFSKGCISAGPHYNPHKVTHGGQGEQYAAILRTKCRFMFNYSTRLFFLSDDDEKCRHVGDLGNITADENGIAQGSLTDKLVKL
jgi:Cu/Zn superoxide dismutase